MSGFGNYYIQSWKENKTEKVNQFNEAKITFLGIKKIDANQVPNYEAAVNYNFELL